MMRDVHVIAHVPAELRRRLAGDPDSTFLRRRAREEVESTEHVCPPLIFDEIVDRWAAVGCPEPTFAVPVCVDCGRDLEAKDGPTRLECRCGITYGEVWVTDPAKAERLRGLASVKLGPAPFR